MTVNARNADSDMALHLVIKRNSAKAVKRLLAAGADANAKGAGGVTPLSLAIQYSTADVMARLLGARAKVNATDKKGQSALYLAAGMAQDKALLLLKWGAAINMRTKAGFTPLLNATRTGHLGNMELLIAKGATVNTSNKYDVTPLHWAAGFAKSAAIMLLLDAKANEQAKDENGRTSFAWAKLMGNLEGSKGYWALNRAQYK